MAWKTILRAAGCSSAPPPEKRPTRRWSSLCCPDASRRFSWPITTRHHPFIARL